jgi:hypothetical protein
MLYQQMREKVEIKELQSDLHMNIEVMQGGMSSPILFNILFDFIINRVIDETDVIGVQFSYNSNDFFHGESEKYEMCDLLVLLYVDNLMVLWESAGELERFIRTFERVIEECGLTMSMKKSNTMNLEYFEKGQRSKKIQNRTVTLSVMDVTIQNQMIATVDSFT